MPDPTPPPETFGARLARLRQASGLSQYALAHKAGVSRAALGRIEANSRSLNVETLRRLAVALGASLGDFDDCAPPT